MAEQVLFEHPKRDSGIVRVSITSYNGSGPFLNLREWAVSRNGELVATRKGVTLPLEAMRDLGEALLAAHASNEASTN